MSKPAKTTKLGSRDIAFGQYQNAYDKVIKETRRRARNADDAVPEDAVDKAVTKSLTKEMEDGQIKVNYEAIAGMLVKEVRSAIQTKSVEPIKDRGIVNGERELFANPDEYLKIGEKEGTIGSEAKGMHWIKNAQLKQINATRQQLAADRDMGRAIEINGQYPSKDAKLKDFAPDGVIRFKPSDEDIEKYGQDDDEDAAATVLKR